MVFVLLLCEVTYNDAFIVLITLQEAQILCRFLEDWQTESLCLSKLYLKDQFLL